MWMIEFGSDCKNINMQEKTIFHIRRNCVHFLRFFCCIGFVAARLAVVGDIVAWLSAAWKCLRGRASFNQYYEPGATGNRRYYEPDSRSAGTDSGRTI